MIYFYSVVAYPCEGKRRLINENVEEAGIQTAPRSEIMRTSGYPKVETVNPLQGKRLRVRFDNGKEKIFDCHALLNKEPFTAFKNESFFR